MAESPIDTFEDVALENELFANNQIEWARWKPVIEAEIERPRREQENPVQRQVRERRAEVERTVANIERLDPVLVDIEYDHSEIPEKDMTSFQRAEASRPRIWHQRGEQTGIYGSGYDGFRSREEPRIMEVQETGKAEVNRRQVREEAARFRGEQEKVERYRQGYTRLERERLATQQRRARQRLAEEQAAEEPLTRESAETQLPFVRVALPTEAPPPVTVQDVAELLPWTWVWVKAKCKIYLRESSTGGLVVLGLTTFVSAWTFSAYAYQFIFGIIFYTYAYIRAALGDDLLVDACYRLRRDRLSFWSTRQSAQTWFQLMRCQGSEAGYDETSWGFVRYISDPIGISPGWVSFLHTHCWMVADILRHSSSSRSQCTGGCLGYGERYGYSACRP